MVKGIHAELYKAARRPYFWGLTIACTLMALGAVYIFWIVKHTEGVVTEQVNLPFLLLMVCGMAMSLGLYFVVVGADLVFSDQYKHNTLKNEVSFGIPRHNVYLSRCIAALLVMVVELAVLLGVLLLAGLILLGIPGEAVSQEQFQMAAADLMPFVLKNLGVCLITALPLWIGGLSLSMFFYFLCSSSTFAALASLFVAAAVPSILEQLGNYVNPFFTQLYHLTLAYPLTRISNSGGSVGSWGQVGEAWLIGLGWTAVTVIVGLLLFRRREIK